MTLVRVAIPVLRGKRRFHLNKGRAWSAVEHLVLTMLAEKAGTANMVATEAKLPRRLVLEALTRLMHASWVELTQTAEGVIFRASSKGREAAKGDELRAHPKPTVRPINLIIDKVVGTVYRRRELTLYEKHLLEERQRQERIVWVEPRDIDINEHVTGVVSALFDEDEQFVSMDSNGARLVDRYALFTVRDGVVQNLPVRTPVELEKIILDAAEEASVAADSTSDFRYHPTATVAQLPAEPRSIAFASDDIILGPEEHERLFRRTIERCERNLVIHSTFIDARVFEQWKPLILKAVERGVLVHVMWGEDEEKSKLTETRRVVSKARDEFTAQGLSGRAEIHPFSTRSHAKLIVADTGRDARHVAVVGSCNWLNSDFSSFEASVRIRDPQLTADVIDQLASLSVAPEGHWTGLTNHLARLALEVKSETAPQLGRAEGCLVLGPEHAAFVRRARDTVQKMFFVTSHRIGAVARPAVIIPAIAALDRRPEVEVQVYYGRPGGKGDGQRAAEMTWEAQAAGVKIRPIREPRVHAKILAWDEDYAVISSQNWLSADPSENKRRREIGVFIHAAGVSRRIRTHLDALRRES
jgi:phospholipase D-like protein